MTDASKGKGRPSPKKARNWVWTLNHPRVEPATILQRCKDDGNTKYCIFQSEKGTEGTAHYQGYIEFSNPRAMSSVKRLVGKRTHVEVRRGNAKQAREYCRKNDTRVAGPWEYGEFTEPRPGNRTDIHDAITTLARTRSLRDVAVEHGSSFIKYHRGFSRYLQVTSSRRSEAPKVSLYFGPTGTGKTRKAIEENESYFRKHPDTKWFDGYTGQKVLLLDDFSGASSKMSLNYLLQLIDRYPMDVEVKGGYESLQATTIIITTNNHPNLWYEYKTRQGQYLALARRFHHVWVFDEKEGFRVDRDKFFGKTPYETPTDYRKIVLTRPRLQRQDATIREPVPLEKSKTKLIDLTLSGTEGNSSDFDSIDNNEVFDDLMEESEDLLDESLDLADLSDESSGEELVDFGESSSEEDFEPKRKRRRKG